MNVLAATLLAEPPVALAPGKWRLQRRTVVESTMALARDWPAWSAVVADEQTAGRGQLSRRFVSDCGGVYLTAVLPYGGDPLAARGFALAVGWALREALRELGVDGVRLKWPNDLMIGRGKVGGILVEQGRRDTLLVGVGLNVTNQPWRAAPELAGIAGTLGEAAEGGRSCLPDKEALIAALLRGIARAHEEFARCGLAGLRAPLNECWGGVRAVELTLVGGRPPVRGDFLGIDEQGALHLLVETGFSVVIAAHHVERLREI